MWDGSQECGTASASGHPEVGLLDVGVRRDLRGRALPGDLAVLEDDDPVGAAEGEADVLLDEPTLGLSVGVKEAIVGSIQVIKDAGTTMLLVEQDVGFAFRCADRVIVLEHGQVAREGPTAQIAADPYVKQACLGVA